MNSDSGALKNCISVFVPWSLRSRADVLHGVAAHAATSLPRYSPPRVSPERQSSAFGQCPTFFSRNHRHPGTHQRVVSHIQSIHHRTSLRCLMLNVVTTMGIIRYVYPRPQSVCPACAISTSRSTTSSATAPRFAHAAQSPRQTG